jgi:hypothetical protein
MLDLPSVQTQTLVEQIYGEGWYLLSDSQKSKSMHVQKYIKQTNRFSKN